MGLQVYRSKRKFDVTPEPRGRPARSKGDQFVIQKHAARRLHYDLRLELDGVMKSWAVTRGPSLVPGEKRLAVEVEDHPIEYNKFEGTIPQGEYGGGTVMIWDRGRWFPEGDPHEGLEKGHLSFRLEGKKLKGGWHLIRMRGGRNDGKENWLLIKAGDEAARSQKDRDILEEMPLSAASGRSIEEIGQGKGRKRVWHSNRSVKDNVKAGATKGDGATVPRRQSAHSSRRSTTAKTRKAKARPSKSGGAPLPDFVPPALATLRTHAPSAANWAHEVKFDGYRIQARLDHGAVRLLTRKGLDWTHTFPNVAAAVAKLPARAALIDGELVVEDETGISSFSTLQADLKAGRRDRFVYYLFDLLHLDGRDLTDLPLLERKAALQRLLASTKGGLGPIRFSEHFADEGSLVLKEACRMKLEGIVSKRKDAPYRSGRSETWIKTKCSNRQEFVVAGYAPSNVLPKAVGALIVGYYDQGRLRYGGRVGTGYSRTMAKELWKKLHPLETSTAPFDPPPAQERRRRDLVWVRPELVIEADFRGWTGDRLVRQAAFKGLRDDKPAKEVVREVPAVLDARTISTPSKARASKIAAKASKIMAKKSRRGAEAGRSGVASARDRPKPWKEGDVRFTHPDRVYWVDVGVTKQDLADYYRAVWDWMAPQVVGRTLAMVRCPEGTKGECFFQKHAHAGLSEQKLRTVTDSKGRQVIAVEDLNGVLALVQAGVLEIHVRGSLIDRLDRCNRIVFDLDPGEGVAWPGLVDAAREVRERLAAIDLESFVKLSGGKGLHVVVPIVGTDWDTTKTFVQAFAQAMAADDPKRYLAKMTKSLRGGKIFIDYLRNSLEQTSVAAYSTRARAGAPVSVPVAWQELGHTTGSNQYTVLNLMKRLGGLKQDPWKDIGRIKQKLPDLQALRKRG